MGKVKQADVIGRLAPSPTGALHLGNARSFLLAWLSARQQAGTVLLRIEDIDSPRVKPWAVDATIEDLAWLGLDWDAESPHDEALIQESEGVSAERSFCDDGGPMVQSQHIARYRKVLSELIRAELVYPCTCTRSEVDAAASAPHETHLEPLEGTVYPGICRPYTAGVKTSLAADFSDDLEWTDAVEHAYRFAFADEVIEWSDEIRGLQSANPLKQLGDFVIGKSTGVPAYQLAVVVDDHDSGVNEVVRGDDLIYSTYRQVAILESLGWKRPRYYHVPLIVGADGRRLAKRHGDTRLSYLMEQGVARESVVGYLAWTLGMIPEPKKCAATELLGLLEWKMVTQEPTVFDLQRDLPLLKSL